MADRSIKLKDLRRILRSFSIDEDTSMGKGSHTTFLKRDKSGKVVAQYPVPTTSKDVLVCYVRGCRKRFQLRVQDGISDQQFYDA
jgi:hypothetical protein